MNRNNFQELNRRLYRLEEVLSSVLGEIQGPTPTTKSDRTDMVWPPDLCNQFLEMQETLSRIETVAEYIHNLIVSPQEKEPGRIYTSTGCVVERPTDAYAR